MFSKLKEPFLELDDIQGHILYGFGGGFHSLLGLKFNEDKIPQIKKALIPWVEQVSTARVCLQWRELRRTAAISDRSRPMNQNVMIAMGLSGNGMNILGASEIPSDSFYLSPPTDVGLKLRDEFDIQSGHPLGWKVGDSKETTPDLFIVLASDSEQAVRDAKNSLISILDGLIKLVYTDDGCRLPKDKEHFGFRDGVSQPGVRGILDDGSYSTKRAYPENHPLANQYAKPGQPLVWPGQFLFGYRAQQINTNSPGDITEAGRPKLRNGSLLVFRRLRQDVGAFQAAMKKLAKDYTAKGMAVDSTIVAAWCVGRWPDGTPVSLSPKVADEEISGDHFRLNGFLFDHDLDSAKLNGANGSTIDFPSAQADRDGLACPFFAHIRKVNPRDQTVDQGTSGITTRSQMLRRGITYGKPWSEKEDGEDRGLLFMAYMTSVKEQFMRLNSLWANNRMAPPPGHGIDPIIGAPLGGEFGDIRPLTRSVSSGQSINNQIEGRWVHATGTGVFFMPSIQTLTELFHI